MVRVAINEINSTNSMIIANSAHHNASEITIGGEEFVSWRIISNTTIGFDLNDFPNIF